MLDESVATREPAAAPVELPVPLGLMWPIFPNGTPPSREAVAIGRSLFFDKRLSRDGTISCATCHDPSKGFADGRPLAVGIRGQTGRRNSATVLNAAFFDLQGWTGDHASLEEQSLAALTNPEEMALPADQVVDVVDSAYGAALRESFGDCSAQTVVSALAAYQRTLISGDAPFDRYVYAGDPEAVSEEAKNGFRVFIGKGRCIRCHFMRSGRSHPFGGRTGLYTDGRFHNIGIGLDQGGEVARGDTGRYEVTGDRSDWGAFKTPILRNVALTAPYMHDGSLATLEEVVEHYDKGGTPNRNLDPDIVPLQLRDDEKRDLVEYLKTLTSSVPPDT